MSGVSKARTVGIDLGTTNSEIYKMEHGQAVPCVGPNKITLTPSRVMVDPNSDGDKPRFVVGAKAKNLVRRAPQNEIYEPKRIIGRKFDDLFVKRDIHFWPFTIIEGENGFPVYSVGGKDRNYELTAEDVDAQILRTMKEYVKEGVEKAVITVPSYFSKSQIDATRKAGEDAGFEVKRIIPEPVAAAIAYGRKYDVKNHIIMVYDLGGGTFDCCIVRVTGNQFHILANNGHSHLGGADFDNAIVRFVCEQYKEQHTFDLYEQKADLNALKTEAEKTKIALSDLNTPTYRLKFAPKSKKTNGEPQPEYIHDFTRAEFEGLIQKYVDRTIELMESAIASVKESNLSKSNIDDIVCVGGSTRIPLVRQSIKAFFGDRDIDFNAVNIDEAVAEGAAIYADSFEDGIELLQDASERSGEEIDQFPQPDRVPCVAKNIYYNYGNGFNQLYHRGQQFSANLDYIRRCRNLVQLYDNMKFINVDIFCSDNDNSPKEFLGRCRLDISTPSPKEGITYSLIMEYSTRGSLQCIVKERDGNSQSYECYCRGDDLDDTPDKKAHQLCYRMETEAREQLRRSQGNDDEAVEQRKKIIEFITFLEEFGMEQDVETLNDEYKVCFGDI